MRIPLFLVVACLAPAMVHPVSGGEADWHLDVRFEDDSRLVGTPAFESIAVRVPEGTKEVPLAEIAFASLEEGRWSIHRRGVAGVSVKGEPADASLRIETILGPIDVPLARVSRFEAISFAAVPDRFPARRHLVMYHPFDLESRTRFTNRIAPRHHATIENRVRWTKAGHRGGAVLFDGAGTLSIPHHADLCPEAFTLAMWVWPDDPRGGWQLLASKTETAAWVPGYGFCRWPEDNRHVYFYAGNYSTATAKEVIPQQQWTHLAGTFDGQRVTMYVNGEPTEPVPLPPGTQPTLHVDTPFLVGGGNAYNWSGRLDELVFYNRALTIREIEQLMTATSPEGE